MKRLVILFIIIFCFYECGYLKDTPPNKEFSINNKENNIIDEFFLDSIDARLSSNLIQMYGTSWLEDSLDIKLIEHFFDEKIKVSLDSSSNVLHYKCQIKNLKTGKSILKDGKDPIEVKRKIRDYGENTGERKFSFVTTSRSIDEIVDVKYDNQIITNVILKKRYRIFQEKFEVLNLYFLLSDDSEIKILKDAPTY